MYGATSQNAQPAPHGDPGHINGSGHNGVGMVVGTAKVGTHVCTISGLIGIPKNLGALPGISGAQLSGLLKHHCAPYQQANVSIISSTLSDISLNSSSEILSSMVILLRLASWV